MKLQALILHTFREVSAKAMLWVLAGISTLVLLLFALALSVQSTEAGYILTFFGQQVSPPLAEGELGRAVGALEAGLAGGLMGGVFLFGVFATAGIVPDALEKGIVDLYLSKPIARWQLLAGKSLGAVAVIFANILYFMGAFWLIIGLKTGTWSLHLLGAALLMTVIFACLFSIVAFFGVVSRNMAIAIIGSYLYLLIIGSILQNREQGLFLLSSNALYRSAIDVLYYAFPQVSGMQNQIAAMIVGQKMDWAPFGQSLASSGAIYAAAAAILHRKDF
jgi:ABC-type transport system involved in multi-copper enzyme maturation permease subunit